MLEFWELVSFLEKNRDGIPENTLKEIEIILSQVAQVILCAGSANYEEALSTLKKLIKKHYKEFPKKIQEKIKIQ